MREIKELNELNIGETLKELRTTRGKSVKDVASEAHLSTSVINRYEANKRTPSLRVFATLLKILDAEIFFVKR